MGCRCINRNFQELEKFRINLINRIKISEKVDLAILIDGEVKMLVECTAKTKLNSNYLNQLLRYYSVSDCKIGVLTMALNTAFLQTRSMRANGYGTHFDS
ncbi:type I restriction enzyme HsdR N-terminal domain-containing protein [uncultured Methanobrevibacter sp.]|uniref:type I restriction enzyme HsdR N-terminal domain-containing protein n=1 Tax=uncultured Methanobrevibacter sp. TaxID=253161 RepID=UPI0025CFB04F|nr:type I restriction enzyme HsdR N-terminal domain-containing protein [uncultured Methanobrevibacter sp.]